MKRIIVTGLAVLLFLVFIYAAPKTYQVTGPVLNIQDDIITVQKSEEKWEILKTADTQVAGRLDVGAKVKIEYRMVATKITVQ
ncbi:MAG: hypothetical protein ABSF88_03230 [Candidatus Aminicenantales bacterium]